MRIHGLQWNLLWHDKPANFQRVRDLLDGATAAAGAQGLEPGDLLVLPEMFATGYTMDVAAAAEGEDRPAERFLAQLARSTGATVLGGVVRRDPDTGRGLNQALAVAPDGREAARYTKMHPLTLAGEADAYTPGGREVTFEVGEVKVAPLVCYDLRFPERARAMLARDEHGRVNPAACPHVLAVIACWPAARWAHWVALLKARAIENQAYVLGVNRTGADPNHQYAGQTIIVNPLGEILADAGPDPGMVSAAIDLPRLHQQRADFPVLADIR